MNSSIRRPRVTCARCGHVWLPRPGHTPERCPKCHSRHWNSATWTEEKRRAVNKALAEYLKSEGEYHDKLGDCCGITWLTSGKSKYSPTKALSPQTARELDKLAQKTEEKRQAWIRSRRS